MPAHTTHILAMPPLFMFECARARRAQAHMRKATLAHAKSNEHGRFAILHERKGECVCVRAFASASTYVIR